ncbi:anti-sigma B factor RsbW [Paenibacillus sp. HJGM_3]|uniref:anti-sigma B factor RsbW n=1 Tax=Paenibacillus sp. HJGM_3 TaxID=3379816 RepID=UPI00385B5163
MNSVRLVIPADAGYVDVVRLCLYGLASKSGFSYEEIEDMKVAVAEACNNAVLHAYPVHEAGVIDISFEPEDSQFTIVVKDSGLSFNPLPALEQAAPIRAERPQELREGGLGLYLMQALMDEVTVENDHGTIVKLVKYKTNGSPRVHG